MGTDCSLWSSKSSTLKAAGLERARGVTEPGGTERTEAMRGSGARRRPPLPRPMRMESFWRSILVSFIAVTMKRRRLLSLRKRFLVMVMFGWSLRAAACVCGELGWFWGKDWVVIVNVIDVDVPVLQML